MDKVLAYIIYKDEYSDREWYDLIGYQCQLPEYCDLFEKGDETEIAEEYRQLFSEGASVELLHENIRISDMGTLMQFLLEDAKTHNSMDESIIGDLVDNRIFVFGGDNGGLGFYVDHWDCQDYLDKGDEPYKSVQYWFDDYQE
jgi:hypothetical protein